MAQCSEDELYQRADNLVGSACNHFQSLFLRKWLILTGAKWNGKDSAQVLVDMLGVQFSKLLEPHQKKQVRQGLAEEWDITLLSRLLIYFSKGQKEENQAIQSITKVRNDLAHNARKRLNFEDYSSIENQVKKNLIILGIEEDVIQKVINEAEKASLDSAVEQLHKLLNEGDDLFNKKSYEQAIQVYSDAIILPNIPPVDLSALLEKRAFCYYSISKKNVASGDAEKAIELNPNSWKGHHILALIYQGRSKMDQAQEHFRRALAISPGQQQVIKDLETCKIHAGKIARHEHLDPQQLPRNLSERVADFNDATSNAVSKEMFLKLGEFGGELNPGYEHVAKGHHYSSGWGVPQDHAEAAKHYARAAELGNAEGIYNLAILYRDGLGVKRDITHAIELLLEAAGKPVDMKSFGCGYTKDPGVLGAYHALGMLHAEGIGFPKDRLKAVYWYKMAADNGCGHGANNLAILYSRGEGIPVNEKMAEMYWKIAVADKNVNAAYSLHLYYLEKMEPQLARSYFEIAIELGHDGLEAIKSPVFERIEEMEKKRLKVEDDIGKFEKSNKLSIKGLTFFDRMQRYATAISPEMGKMMEDVEKVRKGAPNCVPKIWNGNAAIVDIKELSWKARQGSKTAQSILKCLRNNFLFIEMWEQGPPSSQDEIEKLIGALYICLTTESHHFQIPMGMQPGLLRFLNRLFQSIGGEKSKLDMQLRVCLPFLNSFIAGIDEFHQELLEEALLRYPDEIPLYRNLADGYGNMKEFKKGLEATIKGLLKAPIDPDLLYGKAVHLRLMDDDGENQLKIREAYQVFAENAPADHRKLPEAYYCIASTYLAEMRVNKDTPLTMGKELFKKERKEMLFHYYEMGEDAEKVQLSCYLPYEAKLLLKNVVEVLRKPNHVEPRPSAKTATFKDDKLYLNDPIRIAMIKTHRKMIKSMKKREGQLNTFVMSKVPKFVHKIPKSTANLRVISLREMNPTKDKIFEGRILNLVLIDVPNFGFASIHLIAEDESGEATRLYIYNVEQDEEARKTFRVGAKISVINPYMRIGSQDLTNGIRVDDPKCLIHLEGVDDMCRYCGKDGAKKTCAACKKAKYCGRECQKMDWKILMHKLICFN